MKTSTASLIILLILTALTTAVPQVTNLNVNGSSTNFTMTSGDVISWSFDIPAGGMAEGEMWLDLNLNHAIDPATDRRLLTFTQIDGDTLGEGGPPDMDGLANGHVQLSLGIGFAPGTYVIRFTHDGSGQSVWAVVDPLASPAFSVSGTVHGPAGADLSYIVIEASRDWEGNVPFWHGLTDASGDYTIGIGPDTAGNPWTIMLNEAPAPYTVTRRDTQVVIDGHLTGIDFEVWEAAAQVTGYIYDDLGDTLEYASVYIARMDSVWSDVTREGRADASGRFWIGIPLGDLNGRPWRILQPTDGLPVTNRILGGGMLAPLNDGDSVVHDIVAYSVNSTIQGFVRIDGSSPGFPIELYAINDDSGQSFTNTDAVTGAFSIPVSNKIQTYQLIPMNLGGPYNWPFVAAHPGDAGVFYDLTTVGVGGEEPLVPLAFSLGQNYPNPFNPLTTIPYDVAERSAIRLAVYDMLGREVATLVNEVQEPGKKSVAFDAAALPSGVYTYRIVSKGFTDVGKMLLLR